MPTALEAGTLNVPSLAGLCAGVEWILAQGVETLARREQALGTAEQGTVRFSFSHFNTEAEVLQAAAAVRELAQEA